MMTTTKRLLGGALAMLVVPFATLSATSTDVRADAKPDAGAVNGTPACVLVTTDSRYVPYGYRHVVIVKNGCSKNVSCVISTDVNPDKQTLDVAANTTSELVTFNGSPSQTFVANVACHY